MKTIFVTDFFTGQSNFSCFSSVEKCLADWVIFDETLSFVHVDGELHSTCTNDVIDNGVYQGYIKPLIVPDSCNGLWYCANTLEYDLNESVKFTEFSELDWSCYQTA
jgi:hypothetical protein